MSSEPAAGVSPGGKPPRNPPVLTRAATPWNPRWPPARFLRHRAGALLAQGATPWNPRWPPARFLRHRAGALLAQGATPWNPRWPPARFLRHRAGALLAQGATPWNPRWPTTRFLRHRAGALLTVDVLDVLVPLDPAADPGAQLPSLGLRRPLDRVIELAEAAADAVGHILGKRRPVTERFRELLQVRPRGVVKTPVLAHDVGDVAAVDHALPARPKAVLGQQDDAVDEVVGRELVDLQLGEQQVGDRDGGRVQFQAAVEVHGVGHLQLVEEDVGLEAGAILLVDEPLDAELLRRPDRRIQDIPPLREQRGDLTPLLGVGHQVDIPVRSAAERRQQWRMVRAESPYRQRPGQAYGQRPLGGEADQFPGLGQHRLGPGTLIRRFSRVHRPAPSTGLAWPAGWPHCARCPRRSGRDVRGGRTMTRHPRPRRPG